MRWSDEIGPVCLQYCLFHTCHVHLASSIIFSIYYNCQLLLTISLHPPLSFPLSPALYPPKLSLHAPGLRPVFPHSPHVCSVSAYHLHWWFLIFAGWTFQNGREVTGMISWPLISLLIYSFTHSSIHPANIEHLLCQTLSQVLGTNRIWCLHAQGQVRDGEYLVDCWADEHKSDFL